MVRIHRVSNFFQSLSDQFIERYVALGCKWVTKDCRLMVNQALIGALRRTKTHISSKLVTVVSSAISASVNSYRLGLLKICSKQTVAYQNCFEVRGLLEELVTGTFTTQFWIIGAYELSSPTE